MNKLMKRILKLAMIAMISVIFASVSLAENPTGSGAKTDPCALLAKDDIAQILGKPVQDGKLNPKANPILGPPCEFIVNDYGAFSIWIGPNANNPPDKTMSELNASKIKTTEVKNLGDRSFFSEPGYSMTQLNTWKGASYLIITLMVPGASEADQKAAAEKLMAKAIVKL